MSTVANDVAEWLLIERDLCAWLAAIPEIEQALDHEPESLPARLPVTTLMIRLFEPLQASTGYYTNRPVDDVSYGWRLRLYVPLTDYKRAQDYFKRICPQIIAINRDHPTADERADFLRIRDGGDTPEFSHEEGWAYKDFDVIATREEISGVPPPGP